MLCQYFFAQFKRLAELNIFHSPTPNRRGAARDARKHKDFRVTPDRDFLEQIQKWRKELAKSIHDRHPELDERTLNEAVGRLLDRLVFIRIAEDKRILPLYGLRQKADLWRARPKTDFLADYLNPFFHDVNENLNGEVFRPGHACELYAPDSETLADVVDAFVYRLYGLTKGEIKMVEAEG